MTLITVTRYGKHDYLYYKFIVRRWTHSHCLSLYSLSQHMQIPIIHLDATIRASVRHPIDANALPHILDKHARYTRSSWSRSPSRPLWMPTKPTSISSQPKLTTTGSPSTSACCTIPRCYLLFFTSKPKKSMEHWAQFTHCSKQLKLCSARKDVSLLPRIISVSSARKMKAFER